MENGNQEVEEIYFEKKQSVTESDAVHPRFLDTEKKEKEEHEYEVNHYYYCEQCKLFFAPDDKGLRTHFNEARVKHNPSGNCFYCSGPVYTYSISRKKYSYHNCKTK